MTGSLPSCAVCDTPIQPLRAASPASEKKIMTLPHAVCYSEKTMVHPCTSSGFMCRACPIDELPTLDAFQTRTTGTQREGAWPAGSEALH